MPDIWRSVPDYSETITIKQYVWFQGGICPEKYQLDQIQNDRLVDINFNMCIIWQTVQDS